MSRLPRILCLPGYSQNALIFSGRVGALKRALLKDSAELVFVDPTHVLEVPTESAADFKDKFDSDAASTPTAAADTPRAWWFADTAPDGHYRKFKQFDETLHYLRDILEKQGPFDGVLGFSQGAACAAVLTALLENPSVEPIFSAPAKDPSATWPHPPFQFAILSAGFFPLDPKVSAYFDKKPTTPSLHVLGRGDTIVGAERSVPLTEAFVDARVEWHDGGHHTPSKASWRRFFEAYIKAFGENGGGIEAVKAIPSPSAGEAEAVEGGKL
ncbi:hypothetical protein JCM8547_000997 [Rhodosporidiobolus lusitaniae]